jgi:uncharacterized protein
MCAIVFGMNHLVIVPRWAGSQNSDFYPWLETEISSNFSNRIQDVSYVPLLPNAQAPEIAPCVHHLREHLNNLSGPIVLLGHSVGCQVILRTLESWEQPPIAACLLVAAWMEVDKPWATLLPWTETPLDLVRARKAVEKRNVLISDNDPYTSNFGETQQRFATDFLATVAIVSGRKHFNSEQEPMVIQTLQRFHFLMSITMSTSTVGKIISYK